MDKEYQPILQQDYEGPKKGSYLTMLTSVGSEMGSRKGSIFAVVSVSVIIVLLLSLIILVAKTDTHASVVCRIEQGGATNDQQTNSGTNSGLLGNYVNGGTFLKLPECATIADSPTPELDKARCILESYPLIDG